MCENLTSSSVGRAAPLNATLKVMAKMKEELMNKQNSEPNNPPENHSEIKHKATIRIPCEQYAFIEVAVEDTAEEIIEIYKQFNAIYKGGQGIPEKDFMKALDGYLMNNTMSSEIYVSMSIKQQDIIQTIKRAMKRIKSKHE